MRKYKKVITNQQLLSERSLFLKRVLINAIMILAFLLPPLAASGQTKINSAVQQSRNDIISVVDYHVHLLGPYALPLPDPLPPEVKLPSELDRLLVERSQLIGNIGTESDFKNVFTEDAQLLNAHIPPTDWMRDKHWFMRYLNLWSKMDRYRFAPNHYAISGD